MKILTLDAAGNPSKWVDLEKAVYYKAKGLVAWELGESAKMFHGGTNAISGLQSMIDVRSIISVRGPVQPAWQFKDPTFDREQLLRRDRCTCAFCGQEFREAELTMDHIQPESRGGPTSWMNIVAACKACNLRKANRTPEEAKMPLLYVPYVPNRWETFILGNRRILADQMDFLLQGVPKHSRLHPEN